MLLITYVALNLMDGHGQPALLYIIPFTLGFIMPITFLQDINSEKDKWMIKVKVVSRWKQYYANNNPPVLASVDMIFKDEKCNKEY
nr:signal peptide peptidase-like 2 [Tanacetum cinerariifolium]